MVESQLTNRLAREQYGMIVIPVGYATFTLQYSIPAYTALQNILINFLNIISLA